MSSDTPILALFCRRPVLHKGKQRLALQIGASEALSVGELLLACAIEDLETWQWDVAVSPSEGEDKEWASHLTAKAKFILPQPAGNLGERLNAVDAVLRDHGYQEIIFIGKDAPILNKSHYDSARRCLKTADVALGLSEDGGVTMMGSNKPWPSLVSLPWGEPGLAQSLLRDCEKTGMTVEVFDGGYDVDLKADLTALRQDLRSDNRPARIALFNWLEKYFQDRQT